MNCRTLSNLDYTDAETGKSMKVQSVLPKNTRSREVLSACFVYGRRDTPGTDVTRSADTMGTELWGDLPTNGQAEHPCLYVMFRNIPV